MHKKLPPTERLETQLKRLPKRECAYWGDSGLCAKGCLVEEDARCGYFERAVLPRFPDLRREYGKKKGRLHRG